MLWVCWWLSKSAVGFCLEYGSILPVQKELKNEEFMQEEIMILKYLCYLVVSVLWQE